GARRCASRSHRTRLFHARQSAARNGAAHAGRRRRGGRGHRERPLMELARLPLLPRIGRRLAEGIDSTLLVLMLSLSMLGLLALYSASYDVPSRVVGQLINLAVALAAMWLVSQVHPQTMMRFAVPAYLVGLA